MITQQELFEHVLYNPETGEFVRAFSKRPQFVGKKTGCVSKSGYVVISIKNKVYYAHRLAWLYVYGEIPRGQIDHVNQDKTDNSIKNLRQATSSENMQNIANAKRHSKTMLKGIELHQNGKYRAYITINKKKIHLGYHSSKEAAIKARKEGEFVHHPFSPTMVTSHKQPF